MHAIVVAGGDVPERSDLDAAWPGWAQDVGLVVAADEGARFVERLGLGLDLVVGDFDSIGEARLEALVAAGVDAERARPDKDETDAELAVLAAIRRGARRLTIVGAFGGARLDHELANVALLALPALDGREAVLLDERARVRLLRAPRPDHRPAECELPGPVGTLVSLVPFGAGVAGVVTRGLRYPLLDEPLPAGPARGLSNVRTSADAAVSLRTGLLLIVESPATLRP